MGRKEARRKQILQLIVDVGYIPKTSELKERFKVSERCIRYDLEAISQQIPEVAVDDIRQRLMLRINQRVPEMRDSDLIRLAEFFLSKKTEVKSEVEASINIIGYGLGLTDAERNKDSVPTPQETNTVPPKPV